MSSAGPGRHPPCTTERQAFRQLDTEPGLLSSLLPGEPLALPPATPSLDPSRLNHNPQPRRQRRIPSSTAQTRGPRTRASLPGRHGPAEHVPRAGARGSPPAGGGKRGEGCPEGGGSSRRQGSPGAGGQGGRHEPEPLSAGARLRQVSGSRGHCTVAPAGTASPSLGLLWPSFA